MKISAFSLLKLFFLVFVMLNLSLSAQEPIKIWHFNSDDTESISGLFSHVQGVKGDALKFDGFTTEYVIPEEDVVLESGSFSIEAWVALGAYPWNKAPVLSREHEEITGFFFGIDSYGRVGMQLSDGTSTWHECWSEIPPESKVGLELKKWYHVAGTFSRQDGMRVYINGELVATNNMPKRFTAAENIPYRIGRNNRPLAPTNPIRAWATFPSWYSLDGIIDELKLYDKVIEPEVIRTNYIAVNEFPKPEFEDRRFPTVKPSGRFGANYTNLKYYEGWDRLWPVGPHSDVVVQFDELPIKLMFWRGTRYSACWVTENGKWMADQSRETGGNWFLRQGSSEDYVTGCVEHMSDIQCRSSRVAIIERNDARVVVHWRYLQMDVQFRQIDVRNNSGFGQWADEYYYIYPDGAGMRKLLPGHGGWQETIFLNEPGTKPEDNIDYNAVTHITMDGESKTYSWEKGFPRFDLEGAVIQRVNLKSEYKPFIIFNEGVRFGVFSGEVRPEYSMFPWWNHWPVAMVKTDGRSCIAPDRASHSSLSWGFNSGEYALYGMSDKSPEELAMLARSWNRAPEIIASKGIISSGYDQSERVYKMTAVENSKQLDFSIDASKESPVYNLAFEISNWNGGDARLFINNNEIKPGKQFRSGIEYDVEGKNKLIVFVIARHTKKVSFSIKGK